MSTRAAGTAARTDAPDAARDRSLNDSGEARDGSDAAVRTPNGTPVELTAGRYRALLSPVGATLLGLWFDDLPLTVPADPEEIPDGFSGKTLMPWPNRIAGGTYAFAGQQYQLPINEPETGSALHGLVLWQEWEQEPDDAAGAGVVFRYRLPGEPGYPFPLDVRVSYRLDPEAGLLAELSAVNTGAHPAPYGVSTHPYLTAGGADLDRCTLTIPAGQVLEGPDLRPVDGPRFDYRLSGADARILGEARLDHAFTGLPEGSWQVRLHDPVRNLGVLIEADGAAGARWVQIYTGERLGRAGLAAEPMSCPPNAFNTGTDLVVLAPGERHRFTYRIAAF